MIVRVAPAATVPKAQGKAPLQAPLFELNVSPAGVASATDTAPASLGPLLVTVIEYTTLMPGTTLAGPILVIARSAEAALTATLADWALLPATGSLVTVLAVAVLTIGSAPAYPDGT